MRGDSKMLLHCLEMQQKFKDVIDPKKEKLEELKVKEDLCLLWQVQFTQC